MRNKRIMTRTRIESSCSRFFFFFLYNGFVLRMLRLLRFAEEKIASGEASRARACREDGEKWKTGEMVRGSGKRKGKPIMHDGTFQKR